MLGDLVEYASILAFIWTQESYSTYLKDYWPDYKPWWSLSRRIKVNDARIWKIWLSETEGKPPVTTNSPQEVDNAEIIDVIKIPHPADIYHEW